MSFPRYPKYKQSGVEWLGEVPEHWEASRLKHISPFIAVGIVVNPSTFVAADGLPFIYGGDIREDVIDWENARCIAPEASEANSKTRLRAGDLLTVRVGAPGVTAVVPIECEGGNCASVMLLRQGPFNSRWLCYAMNSRCVRFQVEVVQYGAAQEQFNISHAVNFWAPTPPRAEQDKLAAFLDRETAKIDGLVEEQRRLMELLKEKRQAVISHAVTKGLNPHAPMKPSGIEWLGDVPAHWDCVRNKVVFEEIDERSESDEGELMTVSHITGVTPRAEKDVNMFLAETLEGYKKCQRGDLVINTMWAWMGALGCSPCDGLVSPSYNVYRPRTVGRLAPKYYDYLCRVPSHKVAIKANSTGIWESRLRLYPDAFLSMRLAVPPRNEQLAIVEYLDVETAKWDTLTAEAQRAVDLLQERRTALISATVTGQIDVRSIVETAAAGA